MARRNVLHGASAWEREEKANQQRDYAAQLQEQVLQKQAKQEQEKARKQQEQREELDMLEREREAASRKHHPQQEQAAPDFPPLAQSPQCTDVMRHVPVVDPQHQGTQLASPTKATTAGISAGAAAPDLVHDNSAFTPSSCGGSEPYTPSFSSPPSIFESVFREPGFGARSVAFYEDLAALHRLTAELDLAAKQRHTKAQSTYMKPNFIHQEETSPSVLSLGSPARTDTDKASNEDNPLEKHATEPQQRIGPSDDGLLGESVLLPLGTAMPMSRFKQSKAISKPQTNYPAQQFAADEDEALDNHSEMMRFAN